jgi:4-diphosphocytidyl-2-C-methyl-D-erythritol kinase
MICFPNAKINIGLYVTEKRKDGYHNIETLFYPTKLYDVLEIIENRNSDQSCLWSSSGIKIDGKDEDNLCIQALMLLREDYDIPPVKMHLHKVIPFGAGLGGGSADAAFTLTTLNQLFKLNISQDKLIKYAVKLGADCAFFIHNSPCLASGIGDVLHPYTINLKGKYLVLVKPDIHISTPEAYRGIRPKMPDCSLKEKLEMPIEEWKDEIVNDFEYSVFPNHQPIQFIKEQLYNHGAVYASMTGSGAAVFGIFDEKPEISFPECFMWDERM